MRIPKALSDVIDSFQKLPGIGPKTAQRLAFYLLHVPQTELDLFAQALSKLKKNTVLCSVCKNVSESDPCPICLDGNRDQLLILVVEQPLDVLVFERAGRYKGMYHVLHGAINPLENIGPDEIYIEALLTRVKGREDEKMKSGGASGYGEEKPAFAERSGEAMEIIIATNPTMEGDATAMYLSKQLKAINDKVMVTRLGMGIPTGADVEYADDVTLTQAIEGRREL